MSASTQRLYVTGGRGRMASLIADHFTAPDHEVTLFSRTKGPGFRPLEALLEADAIAPADVIFHLAWSSLPATSEQHPGIEEINDLPLLEKLLAGIAKMPAGRRSHFVFFSSGGAIYGNAPGRPSVETDPCQPVGRYGRAKLAAEALIERYVSTHGLACTVLRISNPYGYPVPKSRMQGLIPHALRCAAEDQPLTLWGDGSAQKDFLYYTDFLAGLDAVVSRRLSGTFNLCAGESHSICEVLSMIEAQSARKLTLKSIPAPDWDVHDSRLDHTRLLQLTGWRPRVPLVEGIRRAAAGYAEH